MCSKEAENMEQRIARRAAFGEGETGVHGAVDAGGGQLGRGARYPRARR